MIFLVQIAAKREINLRAKQHKNKLDWKGKSEFKCLISYSDLISSAQEGKAQLRGVT